MTTNIEAKRLSGTDLGKTIDVPATADTLRLSYTTPALAGMLVRVEHGPGSFGRGWTALVINTGAGLSNNLHVIEVLGDTIIKITGRDQE